MARASPGAVVLRLFDHDLAAEAAQTLIALSNAARPSWWPAAAEELSVAPSGSPRPFPRICWLVTRGGVAATVVVVVATGATGCTGVTATGVVGVAVGVVAVAVEVVTTVKTVAGVVVTLETTGTGVVTVAGGAGAGWEAACGIRAAALGMSSSPIVMPVTGSSIGSEPCSSHDLS